LAAWYDVDILDDLRQLYHRNRRAGFRRSATYGYLERNLKELLTASG
jgi:hypothetical protein